MLYLALSGKMRSGKDTAAQLISNILRPRKVVYMNFSDPIYNVLKYACTQFDLPYEKDREFLQFVGTSFGRRKDKEVFTKIMSNKIDAIQANSKELCILVGDVRFPNEADLLRDKGFYILRIERPEEERLKLIAPDEAQNHESESALKHYRFDYTVYNDGSVDHLQSRLAQIIDNLTLEV